MMRIPDNLPKPGFEAQAHSEALRNVIHNEIKQNKGRISFARFMELALYYPGFGYYSAGSVKIGKEGDFITAPEISPLFSRCIARQCQQILTALPRNSQIIEFGAGSGIMAVDILLELERLNCLPFEYVIIEVSAELRQRQKLTINSKAPHLINRVQWLDTLPLQSFHGVILANEVLDAMPVHRFAKIDNVMKEIFISLQNNEFTYEFGEASSEQLAVYLKSLNNNHLKNSNNYLSEINLLIPAWFNSLSKCLQQGVILLVDYGFTRVEYYHPDRSEGTLMCHYRHRCHADPLILMGLQDITAHVDFTTVAESALANGLQVAGYTHQAAFLLNCGLIKLERSPADYDMICALEYSRQIQLLTSPAEMGELFKVMALKRGLENIQLLGFSSFDQRYKL